MIAQCVAKSKSEEIVEGARELVLELGIGNPDHSKDILGTLCTPPAITLLHRGCRRKRRASYFRKSRFALRAGLIAKEILTAKRHP